VKFLVETVLRLLAKWWINILFSKLSNFSPFLKNIILSLIISSKVWNRPTYSEPKSIPQSSNIASPDLDENVQVIDDRTPLKVKVKRATKHIGNLANVIIFYLEIFYNFATIALLKGNEVFLF
jgi:hypothetical protein